MYHRINELSRKGLDKITKTESRMRSVKVSADAIASRSDFLLFRKYVCGQNTYPHMEVWDEALNTGNSSQDLIGIAGEDVSILAPRNSAKSTFLSQWIAWVIGTHSLAGVSLKILYISYVINIAASKSRQIKAILESDKYKEVFPIVSPSRNKWGENEWAIDFSHANLRSIDEPYTLACSGLFGAINSKRAHLIVFDDLLKSRQEANNKGIQDRMVDNYYNVIRFTRFPSSRAVNLGTRFAKHDINARIFIPINGWKIIKQSALIILPDGGLQSFCEPQGNLGISVADLLKEKSEDEETFLLQRQNELPTTETQGIKIDNIKHGWIPEEIESLILGFDIAVSDKSYSDHSAFVLIGIKGELTYILDAWQEKIKGSLKKIDIIYKLWAKWQHVCPAPLVLVMDKNRYSISVEGDLTEYVKDSEDFFNGLIISPLASTHRGKDKLDRLLSHSLLFEKKRIIFNSLSHPQLPNGRTPLEQLIEEITNYNPLDHNDLLDALELALYESRKLGDVLTVE